MAILDKEPAYKQQSRKKMGVKEKIAMVLAIVVVAVVLYYAVFLAVSQTVVNTPAVANLTQTGTIFSVNSQQYLISLAGISKGGGTAYIYISKLPIFANPLLNITLKLNNITKINAGSYYADIGIQLQSISQNSVTVKVSPLFTSLQIAPDSQYIKTVQSSLYSPGQQQVTTTPTSTAVTTAASTSTVTAQTTTISAASGIALEINQTLKQSYLYSLLLNFSVLYANTSRCTSATYGSTYVRVYGTAPTGPNTYANVSQVVPYNLSYSIANVGSGNYDVNFTTKAQSSFYNNVRAATIQVNASKKQVNYENISKNGIFAGQSITQMGRSYIRASSEGVCGPYV